MPPDPEALRRMVGLRIREARLASPDYQTQSALAQAVGVSTQSVWMWESGQSYPHIVQQVTLARLLDRPHSELFGLDEAVA